MSKVWIATDFKATAASYVRWSAAILLSCVCVAGFGCDSSPPGDKELGRTAPNVFIITIDAASASYLGCYNDPRGTSPNIDRFAKECVLFENAYSQTATTKPSTASLLTGVRATTHRLSLNFSSRLTDEFHTMPELMQANGFRTCGIIGNPNAGAAALGLDRGYDDPVQVYALPHLQKARAIESTFKFSVPLPSDMNAEIFRRLKGFEKHGEFAYIHYLQPHQPYDPPPSQFAPFDPDKHGQCKCGGMDWDKSLFPALEFANKNGHAPIDVLNHAKAAYCANIHFVDEAVGQLFERLRESGLYEDSLVILMSDHGEAFFKHRRWGHNNHVYDDMVRIPLMMKFPRSEKVSPKRLKHLVETIDILPTVLDLLSAEAPEYLEGESLLPVIRGEATTLKNPEVIVSTLDFSRHAIRQGRYKLIEYSAGGAELYDLETDPDEQDNLLSKRPKEAAALKARLASVIDLKNGVPSSGSDPLYSDPEMSDFLKSLGYVGESDKIPAPASAPAR